MKKTYKVVIILCLVAMLFSLTACNKNKDTAKTYELSELFIVTDATTAQYYTVGPIFSSTIYQLDNAKAKDLAAIYAKYKFEKHNGKLREVEKSDTRKLGIINDPCTSFQNGYCVTNWHNGYYIYLYNNISEEAVDYYKSTEVLSQSDYDAIRAIVCAKII